MILYQLVVLQQIFDQFNNQDGRAIQTTDAFIKCTSVFDASYAKG